MTLTETAQATGLSVDTIRYYEKEGMLPLLPRDSRGRRVVSPGALEWLMNLSRLRATGMPMAEMRRFALLVHGTDPTDPGVAEERLSILQAHRNRLQERRAEIDRAEAYLDHKIAVYSAIEKTGAKP